MSVPSTPEDYSSYLLEAAFWIQSLHSRVIAFFAKLNNCTGMKLPYPGVAIAASKELFHNTVMHISLLQKAGQCFGYPKPVLKKKSLNKNVQTTRFYLPSQDCHGLGNSNN